MATVTELLEKYKSLLKKLLPQGFAWDQIKFDELNLLEGLSGEFCRIDERGTDFLRELDPGTADELIPDWNQLLGIPDECTLPGATLADQQTQARQKLAEQGGLSAAFYEDVLTRLGFVDPEVTDIFDFRVGRNRVGDALTNPFDIPFRVGTGRVGERLRLTGWRYVFQVKVVQDDIRPFRVGQNTVGQPLVEFGNDQLECIMFKLKPAHTQPFFVFEPPP